MAAVLSATRLFLTASPGLVYEFATLSLSAVCIMGIPSAASPIGLGMPARQRSGEDTAGRASELALKAFMSMSRAVAIVGPDGKLLLPNSVFAELFSGTELIDLVSPEARRNGGKSDRQIDLADGRAFWVETIPMEDGWLVSAYDMTERLAKARIDTLTKLGNRLAFNERLTELLAGPDSPEAAVLLIDLARFKAINELLGRHVGDQLLGLVASRICSTLESSDVVARLEGDKFGIIQTGQLQPQSAASLANRLVDLIGSAFLLEGQLISTSASVGIVLCSAGESSCEEIMKNADLALHRAKNDGRGTYRFFEKAMDDKMQLRRELETDLRSALTLREFALVYQPLLNVKSNTITGFEALLRWHCPIRGMVSPLEFIPVAEETGIITQIGEWVVRTACREAATWPGDRTVAVNVSAAQFASPNLVTTIISALAESGLDPQRLELEITESVLLDVRGTALTMLKILRAIGVRVALDDFGTGYSSLGYLRNFAFDKIKIDQSFVRGAPDDTVGRAIVHTIASLGQSLGIATVAEGVETEEQMTRAVSKGCTDVQGFLISRPMPPEKIGDFLALQDENS
jgi:diguanylate cyclase (GGDEF)-like protein